jgi:2-(1,2-epoxy-1,2-dihydrophenyl)acetyl-CoA isomerase
MSIQTEFADGVFTLRLNRPERLNAIDETTARELLEALADAERKPEVRVVALSGNGRAFCAGRDITDSPTPEILALVQAVSSAMVACSKPILVSVHGWVVGAGVEWMLDADIALAARTTRFKLPEVQLGVFATGGITTLLPRISGLAKAKGMLLLGDEFSAEQAERWGLVWSVVDDGALAGETARIARQLASYDPAVLGRFKRVINQMSAPDFSVAIEIESRMHAELSMLRASHRKQA